MSAKVKKKWTRCSNLTLYALSAVQKKHFCHLRVDWLSL